MSSFDPGQHSDLSESASQPSGTQLDPYPKPSPKDGEGSHAHMTEPSMAPPPSPALDLHDPYTSYLGDTLTIFSFSGALHNAEISNAL